MGGGKSGKGAVDEQRKKKAKIPKTAVPLGEPAPRTCDAPAQALQYSFPPTLEDARAYLASVCYQKKAAFEQDGNKYLFKHFTKDTLRMSINPCGDGNCLLYSLLWNFPDVLDELLTTIQSNRQLYCHPKTPDGQILLCTLLFLLHQKLRDWAITVLEGHKTSSHPVATKCPYYILMRELYVATMPTLEDTLSEQYKVQYVE